MIDIDETLTLVRQAQFPFDGAASKSRELVLTLLELTPDPFSRQQFAPGHITCSGLVLAPDGCRLLFVHHKRLDRWLLPGGHAENIDAAVWDGARREVVEETGVELFADPRPALVGVDVHAIPSNGREPYHLHHDLVFAFRALSEECRLSHESRAIAWLRPAEFHRYGVPGNVRRAHRRVASPVL